METSDRKTPTDLTRGLAENPQAYNFFRAVRLLEARHRDRPRLGKSVDPREDPVRFGQHPSLTFSRSTIDSFTEGGAQPHRLFVNFMGLFGPNGPLPLHITDYARDRESNAKDRTIAGFLNIFHHRLLSLFYRAWAVNQKAVDLDRPEEASFARFIASFIGLGIPELRKRDSISDWAKLYYSGWLSSQTRNAEGLETILGDYFQMPIRIISFVGHWLRLPEHSVCRLGEQPETGTLGRSAVIGSRVWDCQLKFRVRIGPVGLAQLQRLLPGGKTFVRLQDWVRSYCGDEYLWDAQVVLKKEEVPSIQLGGGGLLGWTTWLKSKPSEKDAEDLILEPKLG
ncbi:type VI secretion protein, VC_A0111 family [Chthoniobacter flavus Ellin428]|uniref:Type VI secretion protein, VC_A0111 family n=1 Tax=Chthoniobacter flavus Ellin428 TaxID=497964 RepID=B4D1Q3_9BACT|nr:type VI secretion system baseplate subunit TssG [Chthoniobacter flavus]EDY19665.1 type VI secretion protein, VC_A0111 family [Chthoniobacter flavus Ellin428]TCO92901.1 type VI secretion system protein ImpH [Chthoniobacter flavus]